MQIGCLGIHHQSEQAIDRRRAGNGLDHAPRRRRRGRHSRNNRRRYRRHCRHHRHPRHPRHHRHPASHPRHRVSIRHKTDGDFGAVPQDGDLERSTRRRVVEVDRVLLRQAPARCSGTIGTIICRISCRVIAFGAASWVAPTHPGSSSGAPAAMRRPFAFAADHLQHFINSSHDSTTSVSATICAELIRMVGQAAQRSGSARRFGHSRSADRGRAGER